MKTIVLTGHPAAIDAAHLQLGMLLQDRGMGSEVLIQPAAGVTRALAHEVHDGGGEVWFCGNGNPDAELASSIDRWLRASCFDEISPQVVTCLAEFVAKTRIAA